MTPKHATLFAQFVIEPTPAILTFIALTFLNVKYHAASGTKIALASLTSFIMPL
jgi:hypothetical protein